MKFSTSGFFGLFRAACGLLLWLSLSLFSAANAEGKGPAAERDRNLYQITGLTHLPASALSLPNIHTDSIFDLSVNGALLDTLPLLLDVELETGEVLTFTQESATRYLDGLSWRGRSGSSELLATMTQGRVAAILKYKPGFTAASHYELVHDHVLGAKLLKLRTAPSGPQGPVVSASAAVRHERPNELIIIDVLGLYSNSFSVPDQVVDTFHHEVMEANAVLAENGLSYRFRLVHTAAVAIQSSPRQVLENGAVLDNQQVLALRDAFGADMVAIFVPDLDSPTAGPCGVAYLPARDQLKNEVFSTGAALEPFVDQAFSAMVPSCGGPDLTFLHELSHNFGMLHRSDDLAGSDLQPVLANSGGVVRVDGTASIMACNRSDGDVFAGVCNRDRRFSDGTLADDADILVNNRRLGQVRARVVANYRTPEPGVDQPPVVIRQFPDPGTRMFRSNVYLSATAVDAEDDVLTLSWRSNRDGDLGTGEVIRRDSLRLGAHTITVTATDSAGNLDQQVFEIEVVDQVPQPRVGLWQDLLKSDTYLALHQSNLGEWVFGWATYDTAGDPFWYISTLGTFVEGNVDVVMDQTVNPMGGRVRVGDTRLRWINDQLVALEWAFDAGPEGVSFLGNPFGQANSTTGSYYDAGDSGWGISVFNQPGAGANQNLYFAYDGNRPIWLFGRSNGFFNGFVSVRYNLFTGGSCPQCEPSIATARVVGINAHRFTDGRLNQGSPFQLLSGSWIRSGRTLTKIVN